MLYVLLAIGVLLVGTLVVKIAARQDVRGDVDRFNHARAITSTWAKQGNSPAPKPDAGDPDPDPAT